MFKNNKAEIPWIKLIVILLIVSIILITFIINLATLNNFKIDDRKLESQVIINSLINSNCFSDTFGVIDKSKFNQNNLDLCLSDLDDSVLVKVILGSTELYYDEDSQGTIKNKFNTKRNLCELKKSNILCSQMKYPIKTVLNNEYNDNFLLIMTIT